MALVGEGQDSDVKVNNQELIQLVPQPPMTPN